MPDRAGEDPRLARSAFLFRAFGWYLRWYFWRNFHGVRVAKAGLPKLPLGRPVIFYTNHPSWWDPAFFILLSSMLMPGRVSFGPMEQVALSRYGLLRRMGVFGIESATPRGAARFLDVGLRVLSSPDSALWITAEGAFTDARRRPVRLRPGLAHLARRVEGAVLIPLALEYTFWNERKPEALAWFGPPVDTSRERSVAAWTAVLSDELERCMDSLAEESALRDPRRFVPVVRSSGGVGGIYDVWRRAQGIARGKRVRLSHED